MTRRRGRRRKQLLDDLGDRRGYSHMKVEALDRIKWRNRFGTGFGPVVWQITDDDDDDDLLLGWIQYIDVRLPTFCKSFYFPSTRKSTKCCLFLGAFAKLQKPVLASCLSVRMAQLGSHWTDFYHIWYLGIFRKICRENSGFTKIWQE
jgi:hypothetical protein